MSERRLTQWAPWPEPLEQLVERCTYREGWRVRLIPELDRDFRPDDPRRTEAIGGGATLVITTATVNSYDHAEYVQVAHSFIVPAATYDERSWRRWLFEQFAKVELHECMEFFTIDGEKPYAPLHLPGVDPYTVHELATDMERRTSFRGEVNP